MAKYASYSLGLGLGSIPAGNGREKEELLSLRIRCVASGTLTPPQKRGGKKEGEGHGRRRKEKKGGRPQLKLGELERKAATQ